MTHAIIFTSGYLDGDDDLTSQKGHRSDVFYRDRNGFYYELTFMTLERLILEFNRTIDQGINHFVDVGLTIIDSVTKNSIFRTVRALVEGNYFATQKQLTLQPNEKWAVFEI